MSHTFKTAQNRPIMSFCWYRYYKQSYNNNRPKYLVAHVYPFMFGGGRFQAVQPFKSAFCVITLKTAHHQTYLNV